MLGLHWISDLQFKWRPLLKCDWRELDQNRCCCIHGHRKEWGISACLQSLVVQVAAHSHVIHAIHIDSVHSLVRPANGTFCLPKWVDMLPTEAGTHADTLLLNFAELYWLFRSVTCARTEVSCRRRCASCSCFCHHVFTYSEHRSETVWLCVFCNQSWSFVSLSVLQLFCFAVSTSAELIN